MSNGSSFISLTSSRASLVLKANGKTTMPYLTC
jgi:hypothetical protein